MALSDYLLYSTVKIVKIKDKRLALAYYILLALIFAYIVVYKILYQTGYVLFEEPIGTARLQLQAPTVDACDPDYDGCQYNFTNVSALPYCAQSGQAKYRGHKTLPCRDLDAYDVVFPVTGGSPFFAATRIMISNQTLACSEPAPGQSCKETYVFGCNHSFVHDPTCAKDDIAQENFYVADIERYTLLIDHSVRSPTVQSLQADSVDMTGYLEGCGGRKIYPPVTDEKQDIISIGTLLDNIQNVEDKTAGNCGLSLDEPSTVATSHSSVRQDGLIIIFLIEYSNTQPWSGPAKTISYTYKVEFIKGTKSKVSQELFVKYPHHRVTRDIHGIKIVVVQTGQLGTYDTTTLLLQLTTSLTLLAIATTVVDVVATKVLPQKKDYKHVKYTEFVTEGDHILLANPEQSYGSLDAAAIRKRSVQAHGNDGRAEATAQPSARTPSDALLPATRA